MTDIQVFSLEAPAAETTVVIPSQKQKSDEIHVGLSWTEGLGKYKLTKVITLTPRFLIRNNLREAITFRQHGVAPRERSVIEAGERCPLLYVRVGQENLLTVALPGLNAQWQVNPLSHLITGAQMILILGLLPSTLKISDLCTSAFAVLVKIRRVTFNLFVPISRSMVPQSSSRCQLQLMIGHSSSKTTVNTQSRYLRR